MKPKTAFESGSSPPKVSENGAPIQTGSGLEQVKQRILQAFEEARGSQPETELIQQPPVDQPPLPVGEYTEENVQLFNERARKLALGALISSHTVKAKRTSVFEIAAPTETAEELFRQALEGE